MILLLSDSVSNNEKIIISKDALEVSDRLLKRMDKESEGTVFWDKLRLLKCMSEHFSTGVITKASVEKLFPDNSKWLSYKDEVFSYYNSALNENELAHFKKQLTLEKQFLASEEYISKFKEYINRVENREFEEVESIQAELRSIVENLYMGLVRENNLAQSLDGVKIIDFNDPEMLFNRMTEFYDGSNYISSGYSNIDQLFKGGFERTRLYLLAGKPGSGKSTFLLNFAHNISQLISNSTYKDHYVLYVSLENLALETNQRLLCKHLKMKQEDLDSQIRTGDSSQIVRGALREFEKSGLIISYFPARTFGTMDLFSYIENLNMEKKKKPLAIIVDYLDLMKLPTYLNELRHQLGDITLGLKSLAVMYKIPVISATQLLKGAYNGKPELGSIKESSEKIDHSDAIGLINRLDNGENLEEHLDQFGYNVELSFDKSRASKNGTLKFAMLLNKFLIEEQRETAWSAMSSPHSQAPTHNNQQTQVNKKPSFSAPGAKAFETQNRPLPPSNVIVPPSSEITTQQNTSFGVTTSVEEDNNSFSI